MFPERLGGMRTRGCAPDSCRREAGQSRGFKLISHVNFPIIAPYSRGILAAENKSLLHWPPPFLSAFPRVLPKPAGSP